MDQQAVAIYEDQARVIKAMGHATRLFLVHELAKGERCVCDLQAMVGADMSTVSRHLAVLREVGIIASRKEGNQVFYHLQCTCVLDFFSCVESVLERSGRLLLHELERRS